MSNPYSEEPLAKMADWNAILVGCCCEMPECPEVEGEFEGDEVQVSLCGWEFSNETDAYCFRDYSINGNWTHLNISGPDDDLSGSYSNTRTQRHGTSPASCVTSENSTGEAAPGCIYNYGFYVLPTVTDTTTLTESSRVRDYSYSITEPPPTENPHSYSHSYTETYSNPYARDGSDLVAKAAEFLDGYGYSPGWSGEARLVKTVRKNLCSVVQLSHSRFRVTVPTSHTGTWYKVMWDIIEEPDGWDATPPTAERTYFSQDSQWEWNNPADRTSPWFEIEPPSVPGTRRMVNRRAWHQRGPYGSLPTPFGEQLGKLGAEDGGGNITTLDLGSGPPSA